MVSHGFIHTLFKHFVIDTILILHKLFTGYCLLAIALKKLSIEYSTVDSTIYDAVFSLLLTPSLPNVRHMI